MSSVHQNAAKRLVDALVDEGAAPDHAMLDVVRRGLTSRPKKLPPVLFYDEAGSALFEQITELPEYYLTRAETSIFVERSAEILDAASRGAPLMLIELGAGSSTKTQILLDALVARQGGSTYVPIDVSPAALELARQRLARETPRVRVKPFVGTHEEALAALPPADAKRLVLFIGSSIGNFEGADADRLIGAIRKAVAPGDALLLGTDLKKDPTTLIAAYDDAAGVTAAFNKNVLVRLNKELGANFALDRFQHLALWNERDSRVEMHLESLADQRVKVGALGLEVRFAKGERMHTESSVKYDDASVLALLDRAGFRREAVFFDGERRFGLHLARAV